MCPNFCRSRFPPLDRICGSDCTVYFSMCHFETQKCNVMPNVLSIFKHGFCPPRMNPRVKITAGENKKIRTSVSVSRGSTVLLTCHVTSSQHHTITWRHNDRSGKIHTFRENQVVTSTTVHNYDKVTSESVLKISDFKDSQEGDYTCQAEMCGAMESKKITLQKKKLLPIPFFIVR